MTIRIAHITDVHWMVEPSFWRVWYSKRVLGTANLYLRGRRYHFHEHVQQALVDYVVHMNPDVVVITGDLTAQAMPSEFQKAKDALAPILTRFPTFVIPGNHDVYTIGSWRTKRIQRYFGEQMGLDRYGSVGRMDHGDVTFLGIDPNRPWYDASGELPEAQLKRFGEVLAEPDLRDRFIVLACHYPILSPKGKLYDGWGHGLRNAKQLVDVIAAAPARPRVVLHGHKHHGYHGVLTLPDGGRIDTYNPGSGGYAYNLDERRAAACNEYVIDDGRIARVERHVYDGKVFAIEPGGAYASGW